MPTFHGATCVIALLVAGCGTAAPSATSSSAPSLTPVPTTAASAESSPRELTAGPEPLPPGRYTRPGFLPPITLELDEGWVVGTLADGFFDVQQDRGTPHVIAVQFGRVEVVVGVGGSDVMPTSAREAAQAIAANPGLEVLGESESRLGGLTGFNVEVENTSPEHATILAVPAGRLGIDPGRRLWISLFDTSDGLLAVMVGGSVAQWARALGIAEPVLESILIGGPSPAAWNVPRPAEARA